MSDKKSIVILGGGTVSHIRNHLALCMPAYGTTARLIKALFDADERFDNLDKHLHLTKMAGGPIIETNDDVAGYVRQIINDLSVKIVIFNVALCDFDGSIGSTVSSKYADRLSSKTKHIVQLTPAEKLISKIRKTRKDIFLVGFKTTCNASEAEQYSQAMNLLKSSSCNLVLANDTGTRVNMIVTPEEAKYHVTQSRHEVLSQLVDMVYHRSHLTFTRSTVIDGESVSWSSSEVPESLRTVVDHCIKRNAYKPFRGATVGHFACKLSDTEFLTSIRKSNFNDLMENGLVRVKTDGPDTVIAYGARPSVGGQSQRIVFNEHPDYDCIVHFHCPIKPGSKVPTISQREYECGSHQCGQRTSTHLEQFGPLSAVYLDNHGPNIVFNKSIDPQVVIDFIEEHFDLTAKTGGYLADAA